MGNVRFSTKFSTIIIFAFLSGRKKALARKKAAHCEVVICSSMNDGVFSAPHEYCTMLCRDRCNILISHRFLVHRRGVHKCVHPLGYAVHHPSGQLTVMGHQVMNISEIVAMTLGIGCIRPWSGRDLEHCIIHRQFLPRSRFYR